MNARPLRLSTAQADFETLFQQRLHWSADTDDAIEQRVANILADVKARGDAAVLEYTARFDGLQADSMAALELTQAELKAAFESLPAAQKTALQDAAARVRSYHEAQKKASGESWQYRDDAASTKALCPWLRGRGPSAAAGWPGSAVTGRPTRARRV